MQSLLKDPLTIQLLSTHPNNYAAGSSTFRVPHVDNCLDLIEFYATGKLTGGRCVSSRIPDELARLITSIRQFQLRRDPISMDNILSLRSEQGMSPKKAHEVSRMATYVVDLVSRLPSSCKGLRIVDIGAGQGYLTRALKTHLPRSHILALDADIEQTKGAQKWEKRLLPKDAQDPPIDHNVVFISPETLLDALDDWVACDERAKEGQIPVLFVALHACGSLTSDILRAFTTAVNGKHPSKRRRNWYPAGVVVVGCCYNLMNPSDYPPSTSQLPISAYHLAAQIPTQWLQPPKAGSSDPILDPAVALSIRKVTWRALLSKALETASTLSDTQAQLQPQAKSATVPARWSRRPQVSSDTDPLKYDAPESGTGSTPTMNRLGRLRNPAYTSWNTFLRAAEERLGVVFDESEYGPEDDEVQDDSFSDHRVGIPYDSGAEDGVQACEGWTNVQKEEGAKPGGGKRRGKDTQLENELAVLHVLRCLLGPAIESAILLDRIKWVRKELGIASSPAAKGEKDAGSDTSVGENALKFHAELVNLFDQSTGSGRNVAIVVVPRSL